MLKVIANILLAALAIGLTIFTGSRTLDLLAQWLPANQEIMQYLGLAAFEGGLYFWSFYFVSAAQGSIQRGVALMMIVVCFVSVAVATVGDLMLVGAESGKLPEIPMTQKQAIVIFVGVVIVLNVAAFLAAKLTSPHRLHEMAVQDAEDHIYAANLTMIRQAAPSVAAQAAPLMTDRWVADTWNRMLPNTARPGGLVYGSVSYPQTAELPAPAPAAQKAITGPSEDKGWFDRAKSFLGNLGGKVDDTSVPGPAPAAVTPAPAPVAASAPARPAPRPFLQSKPATPVQAARARGHLRRQRRVHKQAGGKQQSQA